MKPENALLIVDQIRTWLKDGGTIKAIDPEGRILEENEDGTIHGGLDVHVPYECPTCCGLGRVDSGGFDAKLKQCPDCNGTGLK